MNYADAYFYFILIVITKIILNLIRQLHNSVERTEYILHIMKFELKNISKLLKVIWMSTDILL